MANVKRSLVVAAVAAVIGGGSVAVSTAPPAVSAVHPATAGLSGRGDGASMVGRYTVTSFSLDAGGRLVANGVATGSVIGPPGMAPRSFADVPLTMPVDRGQTNAIGCIILNVAMGPTSAEFAGMPLQVEQAVLKVLVERGPGSRLMMPMCAMEDLYRGAPDPALLAPLNEIVTLLNGG